MKKYIFGLLGVILAVSMLASVAVAAKPMVVKMAHMWPAKSWPGRSIIMFCEGVEKATKGRIKFKYFLGGTLYSDYNSVAKSVIDGVQPFCFMYPPMLAVYDARWNAMGLPGACTSVEHMHRLHYKSKAYQKLICEHQIQYLLSHKTFFNQKICILIIFGSCDFYIIFTSIKNIDFFPHPF